MTTNEQERKRPLNLARSGGRLELKKTVETGQVRQSFPHGRTKTVTVEVKRKRSFGPSGQPQPAAGGDGGILLEEDRHANLTASERAVRLKALEEAKQNEEQRRSQEAEARERAEEEARARAEAECQRDQTGIGVLLVLVDRVAHLPQLVPQLDLVLALQRVARDRNRHRGQDGDHRGHDGHFDHRETALAAAHCSRSQREKSPEGRRLALRERTGATVW